MIEEERASSEELAQCRDRFSALEKDHTVLRMEIEAKT